MILTLLHSTQVADAQSERGEGGIKFYQNLIKKIKKIGRAKGIRFYSTPETISTFTQNFSGVCLF
jgi:hypothetical protein